MCSQLTAKTLRLTDMSGVIDEFGFLAGDAEIVQADSVPDVRRISHGTRDGDVSGLMFGSSSPRFTFLHGAGLNAHTFDRTILALGESSLSLDLPGHGRSDWRDDANYAPSALEPAVAATVRAFTHEPQILVGHSLGGLTALRVAALHPEIVRQLVIVDITPGISEKDGGASIREFIGGKTSYDTIDEIVDRAIEFNIGHNREALFRGATLNTRLRPDGKLEWTHHLAHLMSRPPETDEADVLDGDGLRAYEYLWQSVAEIAKLEIPTTLVVGDQGMVSDAMVEEWMHYLPSASVVSMQAGHNVQEYAPRELARTLVTLLHKDEN